MGRHVILLTDQEIADLVRGLEDAQNELCVDHYNGKFPEGTAQWNRWEDLIQRFKLGATADLLE